MISGRELLEGQPPSYSEQFFSYAFGNYIRNIVGVIQPRDPRLALTRSVFPGRS